MIKLSDHTKNIVGWVFICLYLIFSFAFVADKRSKALCTSVSIHIVDSNRNRFIDESDIISLLNLSKDKIMGYELIAINTDALEKYVESYPPVKNVEIFYGINGVMYFDVKQREPIVRIIGQDYKSYYLDADGLVMPLSNKYASHVPVASGLIKTPFPVKNATRVFVTDSSGYAMKVLYDIYSLSSIIYKSPFWKAQVEQIYVNADRDYELVPRMGAHIIVLGDGQDLEYKLGKMKAFYLKGMRYIGWNQYKTINVQYSNQVICTKR